MKYAAKRTWPEKSKVWDHEGDAESIQAFAAEFATVEQLGLDAEFLVMEKGGESPEIRFFRVSGTSPYRFTAVEQSRASSDQSVAEGPQSGALPIDTAQSMERQADKVETDAQSEFVPDFRPAISLIAYMAKVSLIIGGTVAVLAVVITYAKKVFG